MTEHPPPYEPHQLHSGPSLPALVLAQIWAGRWFLAVAFALCTVLALGAMQMLPVRYASDATLLVVAPRQNNTGAASLLAGLPLGLESTSGGLLDSIQAGGSSQKDVVLAFLESRRLAEAMLGEHGLLHEAYATPVDHLLAAVTSTMGLESKRSVPRAIQDKKLGGLYRVQTRDNGRRITLSLKAGTPQKAQDACAAVVARLEHYLRDEYETEAARERRFLDEQLSQARAGLTRWENTRPTTSLPLARIQREVASAARLSADLQRRLALARAAEARDEVSIKVLDEPFAPVKPAGPGRMLKLVLASTFGMLAALGLLFARRIWADLHPEISAAAQPAASAKNA